MLRTWTILSLLLLWTAPAWAQYGHGCGGATLDPGAFGRQTQATIDDKGIVTLRRTDIFLVCEVQMVTEQRTRTVEIDGKHREEAYTVAVPRVHSKPVHSSFEARMRVDQLAAYDVTGQKLSADRLKDALGEETTVLLATRKVPTYYLRVYKPDTLVLVAEGSFFGGHVGGGYAAAPVAEGEAPPPGAPMAAPNAPAPAPAPAPDAAPAPAARPADEAAKKSLPGMAPRVSMAKCVEGTVLLRTYFKDVSTQTGMREVVQDGVTRKAPFSVETESISDVTVSYPQNAVAVYRADGTPVKQEEVAGLLASYQCVLVSSDGEKIDPKYLKIVRPDALILVAPLPAPQIPPPMPGIPSNAAPAPAPASVPPGRPA